MVVEAVDVADAVAGTERGDPPREDVSNGDVLHPAKRLKEDYSDTQDRIASEVDFEELFALRGHGRGVSCVSFSPDGNLLASSSADASVKLWDPHKGELVRDLNIRDDAGELGGHDKGVSCVVFSPDGGTVATASDDKTIRTWDVSTGRCVRVFRGHTHFVLSCDISCRGNMLVSGSLDETVRIWEVRSGECLKEIPAHSDPVSCVCFSPDASIFVSSSFDGLCRVWDTETGRCLQTVYCSQECPPITSVRFTPNGKYLLMSHLDSALRLWDVTAGREVKKYVGHRNAKFSLTSDVWTHAGGAITSPLVVSGSEDGSVYLWDVSDMRVVARMEGRAAGEGGEDSPRGAQEKAHCDVVIACSANPKYAMLATGALEADRSVRVWRPKPKLNL